MYTFPGHFSVSLLLKKYLKLEFYPVIIAGIFPDIIDKLLSDILHITQYGRTFMHSIPGVIAASIFVYLLKGKAWGISWFAGQLGHLIGDISYVPWFYPFISYQTPQSINVFNVTNLTTVLFNWKVVILECSIFFLTIILYMRYRIMKRFEIGIIMIIVILLIIRI